MHLPWDAWDDFRVIGASQTGYTCIPCGCTDPVGAQAGNGVPEVLRTLALRALAVQLMDRTRHSSVIAAISVGGQSGLLSQLMHGAVRARPTLRGIWLEP